MERCEDVVSAARALVMEAFCDRLESTDIRPELTAISFSMISRSVSVMFISGTHSEYESKRLPPLDTSRR